MRRFIIIKEKTSIYLPLFESVLMLITFFILAQIFVANGLGEIR